MYQPCFTKNNTYMEEIKMKKFRKMKKNNKGFSLVELIVVIAIMAVLVGVLGSAILGYIEDANYESDRTALKSAETAIEAYIAEGNVYNFDGTLAELMATEGGNAITEATAEIFVNGAFQAQSDAFESVTTANIEIVITRGNLYMLVPADDESGFEDYESGVIPKDDNAGGNVEDSTGNE